MIKATDYPYNAGNDPGFLLNLVGVKRLNQRYKITILLFNRLW